jgi:hypothetical protein
VSDEALTGKNAAFDSVATALASKVFPVPLSIHWDLFYLNFWIKFANYLVVRKAIRREQEHEVL